MSATGETETFGVATLDELPALVALLAILFAQEPEFTPDAAKQARGLRLIVESPEVGRVFMARVGGRVVAMVNMLATVSTAEGERAAWLEDVIVHPDARGGAGGRVRPPLAACRPREHRGDPLLQAARLRHERDGDAAVAPLIPSICDATSPFPTAPRTRPM